MSFPWARQYQPQNALMRFLDEKLPLPRLVYNAVGAGYPVPRNLSYMWNFGVLAGFFPDFFNLALSLSYHLFNPGRMNTPVRQQLF